jgi:hypothetical protein
MAQTNQEGLEQPYVHIRPSFKSVKYYCFYFLLFTMSAEPWAMVNQDESQDNEQLGLAECEQDEDQESQHLGEEVTSEEGSNNELFDCLVQITIAGQQLLVYHSSSRLCEWNIQGISNFFSELLPRKRPLTCSGRGKRSS